jgi:hypothetical protein
MFCNYAPCYWITFVSSALFDLSSITPSKKIIFDYWSVLTDFCHVLHLLHMLHIFEFFRGKIFGRGSYNIQFLNKVLDMCIYWKQVGLIIFFNALMLLMNCVEFCLKEVWKCRKEEWCNKMKNGQKLKIGDVPWTPQ